MSYRQEVLGEFVESVDAFFSRDLLAEAFAPHGIEAPELESTSPMCWLGVDLARHGTDSSVFYILGGVVDTLKEELHNVEGVKFSIDTKQSLYNNLKKRLKSGAITLPADRCACAASSPNCAMSSPARAR